MLRKSLKRRILFTLAFLFDVYKELSPRSFYGKLYSPLYQEETITQTLSRMAKVGEIEKKLYKGQIVLHISARGESILNEDINLQLLSKKSWDGLWRIVIFDIVEKERYVRDSLRRKLRSLGFALWQESVYITPHSVVEEMNEFFEEKNLFPSCVCFEAKLSNSLENKELATYLFRLEELSQTYSKITSDTEKTIFEFINTAINKSQAYDRLRDFIEKLQQTLLDDPFLPQELFEDAKQRNKAQKTIAALAQELAKK